MIKTVSVLSCFLALSLSSIFAGPINRNCPVKGKAVNGSKVAEIAVDFCCSRCKAKFDKNPSAFLAEVAETAEGKCPISGRDAGKEASSSITVAVCCTGCLGRVENNPKPYLTKLARTLKKGKGGS